ncbi:MAG TPA: PP2C family protein-serine/threonine phosphatase [Candidatus Rifleibacterium sp.]|nr:PP2C family protein-serine/threonine phosphatase [Candidatus Rifleibacterium sp.]
MMTCQYLVINDQTGEVQIANAGHCFPVVVGSNGSYSRMEEIIGTPVGIARKARYKNHQIQLQPGETLILYSDGLIEATSAAGDVFGPDQLLELVKSVWSENLEQFYQNLFQANRAWVKSVDDDLTIVLVRFERSSC